MKNVALTKNITRILNSFKPAKPLEWRTFFLISIIILIASIFGTTNERVRSDLGTISWLAFTISIGMRTSEPPFLLGNIPASPWISSALLCLLIHEKIAATRPTFALKSWPLISVCLLFLLEFSRERFKLRPSPPLVRINFIIVMLLHFNMVFWIEFSLRVDNWIREVPEIIPEKDIFEPDAASLPSDARKFWYTENKCLDCQV